MIDKNNIVSNPIDFLHFSDDDEIFWLVTKPDCL